LQARSGTHAGLITKPALPAEGPNRCIGPMRACRIRLACPGVRLAVLFRAPGLEEVAEDFFGFGDGLTVVIVGFEAAVVDFGG
jgi:hypothetical protein